MSDQNEWPKYMKNVLKMGDSKSAVAVCTLWMEMDKVEKLIGEEEAKKIRVMGNLYSKRGINFIIRNILLNPEIRRLVVLGDNKSGSGDALVDFWEKGVEDGKIMGHKDGPIEKEISEEGIADLRKNVELVDLRKVSAEERKEKLIETLDYKGEKGAWAEPRVFDDPEPISTDVFPFENTGLKVEGKTVAETWLRILDQFERFGLYQKREGEYEYREILNLFAVVTEEDPDDEWLPEWLPLEKEKLEKYYPEVCSPKKAEGTKYTYGSRLMDFEGVDQISALIKKLKKSPDSRGVVACTWNPKTDIHPEAEWVPHKPCLVLFQAIVQRGKVFATSYWRAHNIFRAWHLNVFAMRKMQKMVADGLGLEMGPLTTLSFSARTREDDMKLASELVAEHLPKMPCKQDPRGTFLISVEGGKILVKHFTPDGSQEVESFEGKRAMDIFNEMCAGSCFSEMVHAADIGAELQKAEIALEQGLEFHQDQSLKFEK